MTPNGVRMLIGFRMEIDLEIVNCSYCFGSVVNESGPRCPLCSVRIHAECWNENNGCTTFGCSNSAESKEA